LASGNLRAAYTYSNGESNVGPDNRLTAEVHNAEYTSAQAEAYSYEANKNRLDSILLATGGPTLDIEHDDAGRRGADDDSSFRVGATDDRREYTYLPNGRLGTISGKRPKETCPTSTTCTRSIGRLRCGLGLRSPWPRMAGRRRDLEPLQTLDLLL
jgi:hypothetical protein